MQPMSAVTVICTLTCVIKYITTTVSCLMAVASGPAGPVLAGPVFTVIFGTAHAQIMNNE